MDLDCQDCAAVFEHERYPTILRYLCRRQRPYGCAAALGFSNGRPTTVLFPVVRRCTRRGWTSSTRRARRPCCPGNPTRSPGHVPHRPPSRSPIGLRGSNGGNEEVLGGRQGKALGLTLSKDMTFRDYAQGAFRMRGIGAGQRIGQEGDLPPPGGDGTHGGPSRCTSRSTG